jgi:hypothetical protein
MLTSRAMEPPAGTFLAKVRSGAIQFPEPLKVYCEAEGWDLFRVVAGDRDRLSLEPILRKAGSESDEADLTGSYCSSLSTDGKLWIPAELRESVALAEQSVMMRIENSTIGVYLRKVFDTLGFRP